MTSYLREYFNFYNRKYEIIYKKEACIREKYNHIL